MVWMFFVWIIIQTGVVSACINDGLDTVETGDIVITEFFYNKSGGNFAEYVELFNNTELSIDLCGWIVQIDGIFTSDLNIKKAQIIQNSFSDFKIRLVPTNKWENSKKDIIKHRLYNRLGKVNIEIEVCSEIKSNWAGKFRVIKSNMNQDIVN